MGASSGSVQLVQRPVNTDKNQISLVVIYLLNRQDSKAKTAATNTTARKTFINLVITIHDISISFYSAP